MLIIRLQRVGRKHEPVYRLVLTDSKNGPQSGKFLEVLGHFDARHSEKAEFKNDRIKHWIANGAQLSDTVHNLFVSKKIIEGKKINKLPKKTAIKKEEPVIEKETETITEAVIETLPEQEKTAEETQTTDIVEEKEQV